METQTLTLADFLLARIADDEAVARAAILPTGGRWWMWNEGAPARVLAECTAKRRIVALHTATSDYSQPWDPKCSEETYLAPLDACEEMRALAAVYADHPDWREEWAA